MELTITFILIGIIVILSAVLLSREITHIRRHFKAQVIALEKRIVKLEKANRLRMPYKAQDRILDALSLVSDTIEHEQDIDLLEAQRRAIEQKKLESAVGYLKEALSTGTKTEPRTGEE